MDSIKTYFKSSQPVEQPDPSNRMSKRMSKRMSTAVRQSVFSVPSTIDESGTEPEFKTYESFGEKYEELPAIQQNQHRFSKFSFMSNATMDSSPEDIEKARQSFRMSMTGARRTTMGYGMSGISENEQETPEDLEKARQDYRMSMSQQYRKTMMTTGTEMSDIMEGAESVTDGGSMIDDSVVDPYEKNDGNMLEELKHEIMVNYLFQQQCARLWIADGTGEVEGVMLRKSRGNYLACPPALADSVFADACVELNVQCAMTVNSRVIKTFLAWSPDAVDVPLTNGLRVQVLPSIDVLPEAKKHQFAAFIAEEALLVVWDDDVHNLIKRAKFIEDELMELVWSSGDDEEVEGEEPAKKGPGVVEVKYDPVTGEELPEDRPTKLQACVHVAFTMVMIMALLGSGFRQLAIEIAIDFTYFRLFFLLMAPLQVFFTLFFAQIIVGNLAQIIGPINQVTGNSKFYSALLPRRLIGRELPHVTIQCPVYKEGLDSVIAPTVKSLKAAISTYELQGGSANMFFNDDGMQIIDEDERNERIDFYTDHNIGWTARPKHGEDGYYRAGKFKKASNMNFGMALSLAVEEKLQEIERHATWDQNDEADAYGKCLQEVLDENGRAWADGNIRIGDYIIIIDSDTRVPEDCLLDAVSEMEASPEVGIMQFSSGVMQVVWTYFENGITFFTNLIYSAIRYTVSSGDIAPFVGHNAIIRWQALQQVSFTDTDGLEKFWSEAHVSEDFEVALRLQIEGYIIRMAAWAGDGFKEGVSLTCYDELARWEKYAYGCNELLFNPIFKWPTKGIFAPLFLQFIFSPLRITSKITNLAYIGTYYGIGAAWVMTTANYFATGWYNGYLDKYYLDSWSVWFALMIVFVGLGNCSLAVMRYRLGERSLAEAGWENIKWIPMFIVFLGGLSLHVSRALTGHMFGYNMTWGSTNKEAGFSNVFTELPFVWKHFKFTILWALFMIALMVVLGTAQFIPYSWQIHTFLAWWPMTNTWVCHIAMPIALNPALMTFAF